MRPITLVALVLLAPAAAASPALLFEDPAGDGRTYPGIAAFAPTAPAADIIGVSMSDDGTNLFLTIHVSDLASLQDAPPDLLYNQAFWSWTDLAVRDSAEDLTAASYDVYVDYVADPQIVWQSGWRFWLYNEDYTVDEELTGIADETASTITVNVPLSLIGAAPGSVIDGISVFAATQLAYPLSTTDWAPDRDVCSCSYTVAAGPPEPHPLSQTDAQKDTPLPPALVLTALGIALWRRQRPETPVELRS